MKTTQHTPALEAAKAINARFEETHGIQLSRYEIASLIVQYYGNAHNELLEALIEALPWVEAQLDDPVNKPGTVRAVANRLRVAIAKAQGKE